MIVMSSQPAPPSASAGETWVGDCSTNNKLGMKPAVVAVVLQELELAVVEVVVPGVDDVVVAGPSGMASTSA